MNLNLSTKELTRDNLSLSQMACKRLMETAEELCSWFMNVYGQSKFDFLDNLFHTSENNFPLSSIAEAGRDAEKNLYSNVRYSLICLGDIGEFIVDLILKRKNFQLGNSEMLLKLSTLYKNGHLSKAHYEILNNLRITRNKAVHRKTYSQDECIKLLADILPLCEWVFVSSVSPGDLIRTVITSVNETGITTAISENITGIAERIEIPDEEFAKYHEGSEVIFKAIRSDKDMIFLGINDTFSNPWGVPEAIIDEAISDQDFLKLCKTGNDSLIIRAIHNGANVNASDPKGMTALIICSGSCNEDVVMLLLDKGADKNAINNEGKRAYDYAINNKRLKKSLAVKRLKPEGIIDDHEFLLLCRDGEPDEIISAINHGANVNAYSKTSMNTALIFAACSKPATVISSLINNGAKVNASNRKGNTALIEAAKNNTPDVIEELLRHKANIRATNKAGHYALFYAIKNYRLRGEAHLLRKLCSALPDSEGNTGLITACMNKLPELALLLLEEGYDMDLENKSGFSALYFAMKNIKGSEAVKFMLRKKFFTFCKSGSPEIIKQAIDAGIDVNSRNKSGNTALIYAACYNTPESVNLLLDCGADPSVRNSSGARALDYARRNARLAGSEALRRLEA